MPCRSFQNGEAAPHFATFRFDGRPFDLRDCDGKAVVLLFLGSLSTQKCQEVYDFTSRLGASGRLDCVFVTVSVDRRDAERQAAFAQGGAIVLADRSQYLSEAYGAIDPAKRIAGGAQLSYRPFSLVLDSAHRVVQLIPLFDVQAHCAAVARCLENLPAVSPAARALQGAPILQVPGVFEPSLCRTLIELYRREGGRDSGFMVERDGKTVGVVDHRLKRRSDFNFCSGDAYEALRCVVRDRIKRLLLPRIKEAFQFEVTRMERYLVACYDSEVRGFLDLTGTTRRQGRRKAICLHY